MRARAPHRRTGRPASSWRADEVVITVTDNGPVRTKAEIDAFLVPLRSEKSGGLGLGLAIVRRIIEAYGGTIVFDVVEPQGVRVEARLPARPDL